MSNKSIKVYKNFPISYKIRKPRYWYVDKTVKVGNEDMTLNLNLQKFKGVEIEADENRFLSIPKIKLWNGLRTKSGKYIYAEPGKEYLAIVDELDYVKAGSPTISNDVASGFSKSNYLKINTSTTTPSSFEYVICVTTPSSFRTSAKTECISSFSNENESFLLLFNTTAQTDVNDRNKLVLWVGGDGTSLKQKIMSKKVVDFYKKYWIKVVWDGATWYLYLSTDGCEYELQGSCEEAFGKMGSTLVIGNSANWLYENYFTSSIDLSETYVKVNNIYAFTRKVAKFAKGLAQVKALSGNETIYSLFRDEKGKTLVEISDDPNDDGTNDTADKTWFGMLRVGELFSPKYYIKKWTESDGAVVTYSCDNNRDILVSLGANSRLFLESLFYYTMISDNAFFDYDVRITIKAKTGSSGVSILGRFGHPQWLGIVNSSKHFGVNGDVVITTGVANNTEYWFRVGETYNFKSGQYIHRVCYIKDNGYTKDTLPDESQWTKQTGTSTTRWFGADTCIGSLGNNRDNNSWSGTINLSNVYAEFGVEDIDQGMRYDEIWSFLESTN